ncbi:nicotinamide-nucleotide amidohydrolase family protein [Spiroplasma sp. BIUS-1]|uniref:nicotinamide-nucleotide amidohydrolase family protein n=1 Tax=Spiroplasma sp. BIUS-1 TaxID=216964 RepID=UPI001397015A|nr:nicotinamide-nucleotide amidohydrolase family protein [Spiroplasma sp. BIUS-1]QHX36498.1 competence damage-inducible protein A [Spiroplasma sp. BIUS-1]
MKELFEYLKLNNLTISSCESFTGGYFSNEITNITGASNYYKGGFVCYSDEFKTKVLGVDIEVIKKYGVVSFETLNEMLDKTHEMLKTDIVFAFTGFATPIDNNPQSGISYVGFKIKNKNYIFEFKETKNLTREEYKKNSCEFIINKLLNL